MGMRMWAAAAAMLCASNVSAAVYNVSATFFATKTGWNEFALHVDFDAITLLPGDTLLVAGDISPVIEKILPVFVADWANIRLPGFVNIRGIGSITFTPGAGDFINPGGRIERARYAFQYFDGPRGIATPYTVDHADFGLTYVPEPSTWALMLLGFFGLAATARLRRSSSSRSPRRSCS